MYLQNVTFNIDTQAEVEFLSWMKSQHIPESWRQACQPISKS
jgi:uncharacterized protein YbdZ (MbtH family)